LLEKKSEQGRLEERVTPDTVLRREQRAQRT